MRGTSCSQVQLEIFDWKFSIENYSAYALGVSGLLSRRLFPLLQLTRMALVFTAISNSQCTLLLWTKQNLPPGESVLAHFPPLAALALVRFRPACTALG